MNDDEVVIDSSVIIEYLDEIAPDPEKFTPAAPGDRARKVFKPTYDPGSLLTEIFPHLRDKKQAQ